MDRLMKCLDRIANAEQYAVLCQIPSQSVPNIHSSIFSMKKLTVS